MLKLHDACNSNLLKCIRFAMNDRPKLFEEFYEPQIYLYNYHTRNSRFNLPPGRLNAERNFAIFQSMKCFNVTPAQLCVPVSDYVFKVNCKRIVIDSYGR